MYAGGMWPFAALAGVLLAVFGMRRWLAKRDRSREIDVGTLSDSWLAEQRGRRTDRHE